MTRNLVKIPGLSYISGTDFMILRYTQSIYIEFFFIQMKQHNKNPKSIPDFRSLMSIDIVDEYYSFYTLDA